MLWHEFCHVVTLSKTHNKMPRWLSEGISVYEEGRQDPPGASSLNPRFRAMILGDELTPLSQLSSAFLAPKSPLHLQFAYYESALAVEFLVQRFGLPALKGVLDDLGAGMTINEALPKPDQNVARSIGSRTSPSSRRQRAEGVAPDATWEEPDLPADADSAAVAAWLEDASQELLGPPAPGGAARGRGEVAAGQGRRSRNSRRSIRNTSGRRTPTCCSPPSTGRRPTRPRSTRSSRSWRRGTATPARPTCG